MKINTEKHPNIDRKALFKDAKYLFKVYLLRGFERILFFLPIKKNRILFYVNQRKGFVCNPKYIVKELLARYNDAFELIWVTEYPEHSSSVKEEGLKLVRARSLKHVYYQLTSKVVVVNDAFHEAVILRSGQITMNTWHAGMNYKKIGTDNVAYRNHFHKKHLELRNVQPDIYLSGSRYFTEDTARSFRFDPSCFVPTGSPRNDILFGDLSMFRKKVIDRYGIDKGARLVLYAPTFRRGCEENFYGLDFAQLQKSLYTRFGGDWIVLYRRHYFIGRENLLFPENVVDVSDYEDINELLAASDVLISDYSSCLWDFLITKRPSFVYASDMGYYRKEDRGISYPLDMWPYPVAENNDELEKCILSFSLEDYIQKVGKHLVHAGAYDDGCASKRTVDMLIERLK